MADMLGNVHCSGPLQCLCHHLTDICLGALDKECLQGSVQVSELAWSGLATSSSPLVIGVILLNHPQVSSTHADITNLAAVTLHPVESYSNRSHSL